LAGGKIATGKVLADPEVFAAEIQHAVTLFTVTARAAYLLTIFFHGTWDIPVDDVADV
jgi:hypothetical protein